MATLEEYREIAREMGEVIAQAATRRGEIAVASQEADRRAKRRAAADKWAESDDISIEALDLEGTPSPDGPVPTAEGQAELEKLLADTRSKALAFVRAELATAEKLATSAPQDLTNITLSMQLRESADHAEVADLYARCAPVSWALAKSVSDAAERFGLLVWDEAGTLDAEAPRALARKVDELLDVVAGKTPKRPTTPAYGAQSAMHGQGTYAVLELLEALDAVVVDYDRVSDVILSDKALVAVFDVATGQTTPVRGEAGASLETKAMKRMARSHKGAVEGVRVDYTAIDKRIDRAFGL